MFLGVLATPPMYSMLHVFYFAILHERKGENTTKKKTLHSAPSTCFLFILISYNTFSSLYSSEWQVKWKRNQFTLLLEKIMLAKAWKFENQDANENLFFRKTLSISCRYFSFDIENKRIWMKYTYVEKILVLAALISKLLNHSYRPK